MSIVAVENIAQIGKTVGKKGNKKVQRLNEGNLYQAPQKTTDENKMDGAALMSTNMSGGVRFKDPSLSDT